MPGFLIGRAAGPALRLRQHQARAGDELRGEVAPRDDPEEAEAVALEHLAARSAGGDGRPVDEALRGLSILESRAGTMPDRKR